MIGEECLEFSGFSSLLCKLLAHLLDLQLREPIEPHIEYGLRLVLIEEETPAQSQLRVRPSIALPNQLNGLIERAIDDFKGL